MTRRYRGRGADSLVDYVTKRSTLIPRSGCTSGGASSLAWPAWSPSAPARRGRFGCGAGGLVQFLLEAGVPGASASSAGLGVHLARAAIDPRRVPKAALPECRAPRRGDGHRGPRARRRPPAELKRIRSVLRPGGLLFLTTGNAAPFRDRLTTWRYVTPDVHISFFEPETLAGALRGAGFLPAFPGFGPGWADIIRFKTLKSLQRHRRSSDRGTRSLAGRGAPDRSAPRLSAQPIGWAR